MSEEITSAVEPAPGPAAATPLTRPGLFWLAAFIFLVVCSNVANSVYADFVRSHPLGLISLSSRNRYLAMTAIDADMSWWSWAAIATLRLGAAAVVCHMLGRVFGDRALRWFWRFLGMREDGVRQFEKQFEIAEWILVPLFVGSNLVFVISGAARSSWKRLVPLFLVGVAGRLALLWWLAHAFESQLTSIVDFLTRHQWKIIIISVALVLLTNLRNLRRAR